jgi:hypothetical protein
MGRTCDGGGNRYSSEIVLTPNHRLTTRYPDFKRLPAGVCSLQLRADESPWVVCPRRLLALDYQPTELPAVSPQLMLIRQILGLLAYPPGTRLGVWSEVKLKYGAEDKLFDYTFDYLMMPLKRISLQQAISTLRLGANASHSTKRLIQQLHTAGYQIRDDAGGMVVKDFPVGIPSIIEIMTSSTSGGNKTQETTIAKAFEKALFKEPHKAPGINYRQVWARMVSQLLVKSEVALHWGGKAVWVIQDVLMDYITKTTALNLKALASQMTDEVNVLGVAYETITLTTGLLSLSQTQLFAGKIRPTSATPSPSFQDIIRTPITPPLEVLISRLSEKRYTSIIQV